MFYHARLTLKPEGKNKYSDDTWELDLSHEDLLAKIVKPFFRGETFFCGGKVIEARRVQDLHFNETTQRSNELIPFIRAERRNSHVVTGTADEWYVTEKGKNVTRTILDEGQQVLSRMDEKDPDSALSNRIFIVHGHDITALDQTEILLRRWGLEPVILRDKANRGMTVIEKVETNTDVGYAIVLLTPDDLGGVNAEHLSPRARQNVIFEWGYLVAKLGREKVACLCKEGIELPSDLHGIVRIDVVNDVREKANEIRRELVSAGYELKEA